MNAQIDTCYLCGLSLADEVSNDHVPMKQIFGKSIRRKHGPNLRTLPVHEACNRAYQHDEDYFVNSLIPMACDTYAGKSVLEDVGDKASTGENLGLIHKVFNEAVEQPSGIILPQGKIAKRFEGQRISRIAWKIIRGLHFFEHGCVLPEQTPHTLKFVSPGEEPPLTYLALLDVPSRSEYRGVFDYRYAIFEDLNGFQYWGFRLWDKLLFLVGHHSAECPCSDCERVRSRVLEESSSEGI